jgi:imidazole glycerol-phosphate synthase subunit HisH
MIRVVDYGIGNVQAFLNVYRRLGIAVDRARSPHDLDDATRLILPGVGAFDQAMQRLEDSGMRERLERRVLVEQVPVLGVCVGMQMLAGGSDEGSRAGLNWVPGKVKAFANNPIAKQLPMPHMGWNSVLPRSGHPLFADFDPNPRFYFLHSYYFECQLPAHSLAKSNYGFEFDSMVSNGHIHGVQCHPEKSLRFGTQLLKNFALN